MPFGYTASTEPTDESHQLIDSVLGTYSDRVALVAKRGGYLAERGQHWVTESLQVVTGLMGSGRSFPMGELPDSAALWESMSQLLYGLFNPRPEHVELSADPVDRTISDHLTDPDTVEGNGNPLQRQMPTPLPTGMAFAGSSLSSGSGFSGKGKGIYFEPLAVLAFWSFPQWVENHLLLCDEPIKLRSISSSGAEQPG